MIGGKYTTVNSIIERMKRATGFTYEVDRADVVEWLFDLIDLIGVPTAFFERTTDGNVDIGNPSPITIENYRGTLPCDFHACKACRTYPGGVPMTASTDMFHISTYNLSTYSYADTTDYGFPAQVTNDTSRATNYSYRLNNSYIFTDFQTGMVEMFYIAFPVDEQGYPLIPDVIEYINSAVWYLAYSIGTKLWLQDKINSEKFRWLEDKFTSYQCSAIGIVNRMNADEREAFKNQLNRLIMDTNAYDYHDRYQGTKQYLKVHKS